MNLYKIFLALLVLALFTALSFSKENDNKNPAALGFNFGISRKQALEIIKSQNKKVVEDTVDSKKIRTVVIEGAFIELPADTNYSDVKTKLEFYDNELMASSLIFKSDDPSKQSDLEAELSKFLSGLYGDPKGKEEVLHLTTWTWQIPDVSVVLSTNPDNNITRVEYVYKPLNQSRKDEEYKQEQGYKRSDPAKEMFMDGNYSVPPEYKQP